MVEKVLNHKVTTTDFLVAKEVKVVEDVLDSKVSTKIGFDYSTESLMEEVLNHKVSETFEVDAAQKRKVKKVLDSRVSTTKNNSLFSERSVEEVLNSVWVKKVLNENPTE
jgi:hypothetical protein